MIDFLISAGEVFAGSDDVIIEMDRTVLMIIDDIERFFNMELSRFAVFSQTIVIIESIGEIGVLLNLNDCDTFSDSMNRSALNEVNFSFFDGEEVKLREDGSIFQSLFDLLSRGVFFQADIKSASLLCFKNIPHLGLSEAVLVLQGIFIIWMNLNGEIVSAVNQFDQDREERERGSIFA